MTKRQSQHTTTVRGETDDEAKTKGLATWIVRRGNRAVEIVRRLTTPTMWLIERVDSLETAHTIKSTDFAAVHARAVAMLEAGR